MVDLSGPRLTPQERDFLRHARPGGMCLFGRNIEDPQQVAGLVSELRDLLGPDLLVGIDQKGDGVVRIPQLPHPPGAMALGAADDTELTEEVAFVTGSGLAALGINVDFAPVADINSNPLNPVIADRAFGGEPDLVSRHVAAFVRGLQRAGVAATAKHFPGHGDTSLDSHLDLPYSDRTVEELLGFELLPFGEAISAGCAAVMSAHIVLTAVDPQLPVTLSRPAVAVLRERLGFDGVLFSDALDMRAIADRWGQARGAAMALRAGVDMALVTGGVAEHRQALRELDRAAAAGELDRAAAAGELDPAGLERSRARLTALARHYPSRSLEAGEHRRVLAELEVNGAATVARAASKALLSLGELPRLQVGEPVLLITAGPARESAATQSLVDPGEEFAVELRRAGVDVRVVRVGSASPLPAIEVGAGTGAILFASTSRTLITEPLVQLGQDLARRGTPFVHVALWNPYSAQLLPGPALVTFGWRQASLAAAARALVTGDPLPGRSPVPLTTAGGQRTLKGR